MWRPRRPLRAMALATLAWTLLAGRAPGSAELIETVAAWIVACHQTEAGGRQCEVRNDEGGKPALEQVALLSLTLHDGRNDVDGLVRIADLDLPPRLEVDLAFGDETMALEGVGRRGRLAARFVLPRQQLASLAAAGAIEVRFVDRAGEQHAIVFAPDGLDEALALARQYLLP